MKQLKFSNTLLAALLAVGASTGQTNAEITVGGWGDVTFDGGTSAGGFAFSGDVLFSYDTPGFTIGVGFNTVMFYDAGTNTLIDGLGDTYFLARLGDATVTYGEIRGAGNLFPEDYFGMIDVTSISDQVVRLDVDLGDHRFAISNDLNGSSVSEIEIGYSGRIAGFDVAFGFEADNDEIGLLVGRDFGRWGVQVATLQDIYGLPGPWNQAALTVFYDVSSQFTVAGNVAVGTDSTTGLQSFGVLATKKIKSAVVKLEANRDVVADSVDVEFAVVIPFGKTQPSDRARFNQKEYRRRFIQ
jgi:hypothetical protein